MSANAAINGRLEKIDGATGAIKQVEAYSDGFTRVANAWIPTTRRIVTAENGGITTQSTADHVAALEDALQNIAAEKHAIKQCRELLSQADNRVVQRWVVPRGSVSRAWPGRRSAEHVPKSRRTVQSSTSGLQRN